MAQDFSRSFDRPSDYHSIKNPRSIDKSLLFVCLKSILKLLFNTIKFLINLINHLFSIEGKRNHLKVNDVFAYNTVAINDHMGEFGELSGFFDRFYEFLDVEVGTISIDIDQESVQAEFLTYFRYGAKNTLDQLVNAIGVDNVYKRLTIYHFYYPHLRARSETAIRHLGREIPADVKR